MIKPPPRKLLSLEVTRRCDNDGCGYCFALPPTASDAATGRESMSWELASALLDEGRSAGCELLHLTGGEPTLWPHLERLVDTALAGGYRAILINSNAIRFGSGRTAPLIRPGVRYSVTLNGFAASHEAMRGAGSYQRAERGIVQLLAAGADLSIYTVCAAGLLPELPRFVDYCHRTFAGLAEMTLIQLHQSQWRSELDAQLLSEEQFVRLGRTIGLLLASGYRLAILENPLLALVVRRTTGIDCSALPLQRPGKVMVLANGRISSGHSDQQGSGWYRPGAVAAALQRGQSRREAEAEGEAESCDGCRWQECCREAGISEPIEAMRSLGRRRSYCAGVLDLT